MAINKNHLFEELDGIKCGIVEKEVSAERVDFLRKLLEYNQFTVVAVPSPPPKTIAKPVVKKEGEEPTPEPEEPKLPETFTLGVTDYTFNPINAIFGRILKTQNGHVVTLAYWEQKENESHDEVPYFDKK